MPVKKRGHGFKFCSREDLSLWHRERDLLLGITTTKSQVLRLNLPFPYLPKRILSKTINEA